MTYRSYVYHLIFGFIHIGSATFNTWSAGQNGPKLADDIFLYKTLNKFTHDIPKDSVNMKS